MPPCLRAGARTRRSRQVHCAWRAHRPSRTRPRPFRPAPSAACAYAARGCCAHRPRRLPGSSLMPRRGWILCGSSSSCAEGSSCSAAGSTPRLGGCAKRPCAAPLLYDESSLFFGTPPPVGSLRAGACRYLWMAAGRCAPPLRGTGSNASSMRAWRGARMRPRTKRRLSRCAWLHTGRGCFSSRGQWRVGEFGLPEPRPAAATAPIRSQPRAGRRRHCGSPGTRRRRGG
mmetsp:Transcript_36681/g.117825  ORF Transcript_36681/g.117825 Transcript_36681/m.117825 type:complete len:229 (+) Transcript_36681:114-800(+)